MTLILYILIMLLNLCLVLNVIFIEIFTGQALDLYNLFGIFKAEVITNNLYLRLLPIKIKLGLILPNGSS
jgi:hypothetical protein